VQTTGQRRSDRERRGLAPAASRWTPLRIVLLYAVLGVLWILFSDQVVQTVFGADPDGAALQSAKGVFYVLATAGLLYVLIERNRSRLETRDRQLRAVLDSMVDAVFVCDRECGILDANAAAVALLGTGPAEGRPIPLAEYMRIANVRHPDGRPLRIEETGAARALRGETVNGYELLLRDSHERDVFMSLSAAAVRDRDGAPAFAVVVMRDISEVKRFEGMREEFLSTAAHELKTPLAVVKAYAQLMHKRSQGDPSALAAITRQTDRLNRIVQQLLEISRFRVGSGELRRERFDLRRLAEEVALRLQESAGGRIVVEEGPSAAVLADRERIGQVVTNLVENALRFSPQGGAVHASVERRDREAILSVRDHGVGIPSERQARVFERFYRAHAGTGQDYGGLGLGLDVSREIVARHGGRIWFQSEPGLGSTFSFSLPLAPEAEP
jgi:PAS domain S-box-containing protein